MTEYRIIPTQIIQTLTEVRLYEETLEHIREQHPEIPSYFPYFPSFEQAIVHAVTQPTTVEQHYVNSYTFVGTSTNFVGHPIRVPVKIVQGTSGRVATVFFANTPAPAFVVWKASDV